MIRLPLALTLVTVASFTTLASAQEKVRPNVNTTLSAQQSDNGLFSLVAQPGLKPMRLNTIHHWTLRLSDDQGMTVSDATIEVDGGMPGHGHGLPTSPRVSSGEAPGEYLLQGMRFNMSGVWELKLDIHHGKQRDRLLFQFMVEDTAGT